MHFMTFDQVVADRQRRDPKVAGIGPIGWQRLLRSLVRLYQRARQRRALARLDDRLLADIGVSREAAQAESRKPFWQE